MAEPEIRCVFVETNLNTHLGVLVVNHHQTISEFKEILCTEHQQCFPELGEINISAVKVKHRNRFFHLSDRMILCKPFEGINISWYVYVDATARVDKRDVLSLMDADQNGSKSNHELVEKKREIAKDSLLLDGYTKNLTPEDGFETEVAEKTTKKRKLKSSDGEKSRKKPSVDLSQSAAAKTAPRVDIVDESREFCGKSQVDIVASETCAVLSPREKLDDVLMGATGKEHEMVEKSVEDVGRDQMETDNVASHPENHLDTNSGLITRPDTEEKKDADQSCVNHEVLEKKKEIAIDSVLLDGHTENLTIEEGLETQVVEKTTKKRKLKSLDGKKIRNESAAPTTASRVDVDEIHDLGGKVEVGVVASESSPTEKLDDTLTGGIGKENEMAEKSVDDVGRDKIEAEKTASIPANHLDVTNPEKEKKKRRKKSSKDDVNQSSAAATTTSKDLVNEINGVLGNVDRVDATADSLPISSAGGTLGNSFAEATQKENEVVEKIVEELRRDNIETDSVSSHRANHLDANSGLATRTDTEKKKRQKKSSKVDISQSSAVPTTTSGDVVNETNGVPRNVDRVDAPSESLPVSRRDTLGNPIAEATQKETETGEKIDDDVGSGKAIPSAADNIQTNNVEIDADKTRSVKSTKKKKSKKDKTLSKEDTVIASGENVEPVKVVDGEEPDTVIRNVLDSLQERNETEENLEKIVKKSSRKSKKVVEAQVLPVEVNNAALEETPVTPPINNPKDTDALFTPAKKDAESDALHLQKGTEAADQVKADMGDNFASSQKDDIVGSVEKQDQVTGGAKPKREKKRVDLHPSGSIDGSLSSMKPKERKGRVQHDIEPAKKDAESDALHLEKGTVAANNTEDNNSLSKQIQKEKADMGDNFASSQKVDTVGGGVKKQDRVTTVGARLKKDNLHPGGSIDGSLSSMKPKEKKARVQPASSGTSHLQSRVKNDRSGSVRVDVNSKKEAVKKSIKPLAVDKSKTKSITVNKSKTNFFDGAENESEDESKTSNVSTRTPSDSSSDDDSDVTSTSKLQGNNLAGGTNKFSGSLQDILRRSSSYKKALLRASQSQADTSDDEGTALDFVPDSQAV